MRLPVRTTPEAERQITQSDDWWRRNRTAAPDLFLDEITTAFGIIANAPFIGRPYRKSPVPNTRRLLLKKTRYHVYYVLSESEIRILAVWHAQRAKEPNLGGK